MMIAAGMKGRIFVSPMIVGEIRLSLNHTITDRRSDNYDINRPGIMVMVITAAIIIVIIIRIDQNIRAAGPISVIAAIGINIGKAALSNAAGQKKY